MGDPYPDPTQSGAPVNPYHVEVPGQLFRKVWLVFMAVTFVVAAVVVGFQLLH